MRQLLDFLPLVAFLISYYVVDIYFASGVLIIATILQIAVLQIFYKKVERMHWLTLAMVIVFGSLTIYFHDDAFIKWKVTIIYCLFAVVLTAYQYLGTPIAQKMLGNDIKAPSKVWRNINIAWVITCLTAALLNYYIAFSFEMDVWVNFKVFGLTAMTFGLFIATGAYLYQYIPEEEEEIKEADHQKPSSNK